MQSYIVIKRGSTHTIADPVAMMMLSRHTHSTLFTMRVQILVPKLIKQQTNNDVIHIKIPRDFRYLKVIAEANLHSDIAFRAVSAPDSM